MNLDKILNVLKKLTPREHEVLNQFVSGRLNKEIASELEITIRTVKEHRGRVTEKMEANSLAELVTMIVTVRLHENRRLNRHTDRGEQLRAMIRSMRCGSVGQPARMGEQFLKCNLGEFGIYLILQFGEDSGKVETVPPPGHWDKLFHVRDRAS